MNTWHIHIEGRVQGVGFRPFVYQLAKNEELEGEVNNGIDGVHIIINSKRESAQIFYEKILKNAPPRSRVTKHSINKIQERIYNNFIISKSRIKGTLTLQISPDFGICERCENELDDTKNRRYKYPFITCTNCGPRYSITKSLPYDRERTTMSSFEMCSTCTIEYNDPWDTRHFSQTNSCDGCRINLSLIDASGRQYELTQDRIITKVADAILKGKIIAVKGIGGFLLMADATNKAAVQRLRTTKHRPSKPFAVMYPNEELIVKDTEVNNDELEVIRSIESPIVLLKFKENPPSGVVVDEIAPGLNELGIMRPYAPLFVLLLNQLLRPVIATSGNISDSPIIFTNRSAFKNLSGIADLFLMNNRDIRISQDDSVIKLLKDKTKLFFRRSRGYAPSYLQDVFTSEVQDLLAMGADLKSTFSLTHKGNVYVSQYLGNLTSFDTQKNYLQTLDHFQAIFHHKPAVILIDKHPNYYSTELGMEIGLKENIPRFKVQHHEAHFYSVLAENNLLNSSGRTLGVVWDGTGFGNDGMVWGGEYFTYYDGAIVNRNHIPYFKQILGDKMSLEPRISALAIADTFDLEIDLSSRFTPTEFKLYRKLLRKGVGLSTSSMGRIFDAIASFCNIAHNNTYEGEAALLLQAEAERYVRKNGWRSIKYIFPANTRHLLHMIDEGIKKQFTPGHIAAIFHVGLVKLIEKRARSIEADRIAFSGGVFQNSFLVNLIKAKLSGPFQLYFHKYLSPNDECIAFGQLAYYYQINFINKINSVAKKDLVLT